MERVELNLHSIEAFAISMWHACNGSLALAKQ